MEVGAKDLRNKVASVLREVQKGKEVVVTYRGRPAAVIRPLRKREQTFSPLGFGLWRERKDLKDVEEWLEEKRRVRYKK